jgi:primosomal protein N' (replication factor Y) (superfamily II helicase)
MPTFAEVILPQKVGEDKDTLTYRVPDDMQAAPGQIVDVSLRNKKVKGVIYSLSQNEPPYKTKEILGLTENAPHLQPWQIELMTWISDYYFAPLFRSLKIFLPVPFVKKKKITELAEGENPAYEFTPKNTLSEDQNAVLRKFEQTTKTVSLLHGITGSGKTEIYLHIANKCLSEGKQVAMLVPEISLTPQTVRHFEKHFKQNIAVIHSHLTAKAKENEWKRIHKGEARIVIGSRSALFAPFTNLGVIIMDEEHDSSYKQDQSPRYAALQVAEKMAELLKIKIITGSATPTLESYHKALSGEYDLLELQNRAGSNSNADTINLPKTYVVDLREELKKKNYSIFSELLQEKLMQKLAAKEQSILFLNRRGAASSVICRECGYISKCKECEIPYTYHSKLTVEETTFHTERLICHHCGKIERVPHVCPNCKSTYIKYIGLGTQRVEDELTKNIPSARLLRADRDTITAKNAFHNIYEAILNHKADILIGTQMIAFGLHLPNVNLVGIVLADLGLTIPNFRSGERTFQMITQVAGRAGRGNGQGEVVIQTYNPDNYAIRSAAAHDYKGFYEQEIAIRKSLNYPPFSKLIKITVSDTSNKICMEKAQRICEQLEKYNAATTETATPPAADSSPAASSPAPENQITFYPAMIQKFKNKYRWHVLITGPQPQKILRKIIPLEAGVTIDVDPMTTL